MEYDIIAYGAFLVSLHNLALNSPILGARETLDARHRREGLYPKFAHEPRDTLP